MPRPVPVDLILHALAEVLLESASDQARDLARAVVYRCVSYPALADQWCDGADVGSTARLFARLLDAGVEEGPYAPPRPVLHPETQHVAVAVARRLADVGLSLAVTGAEEDQRDGEALVRAALVFASAPRARAASPIDDGRDATIADLRGQVRALTTERDGQADLLKVIRMALGAEPHGDIVKHARAEHALANEARRTAEAAESSAPTKAKVERQFKVGDRVRISRVGEPDLADLWVRGAIYTLGMEGEVERDAGNNCFEVRLSNGNQFKYKAVSLDLVTPAPA